MKRDSVNAFPPMAIGVIIKEGWKGVMTVEHSPLRHLPPQVGMMVFMILSVMWSGIFAVIINNPYVFGWSAGAHILIGCGIFITAIIHREAEKYPPHLKYSGRSANGEHE
tara:strand:- start:2635 stop:2964 length:330 start_codon:yes stop_codon:yes gene_type:complete